MPKVKVRFYAFYREIAGTNELSLELPEGSKVSDLLRMIEERFEGFRGKLLNREIGTRSYIIVRRGEWPHMEDPLAEGDEFSLFPPLGGGSADILSPPVTFSLVMLDKGSSESRSPLSHFSEFL